ncbi:MAG: DNA repair protein RecN [Lachnospiraceae bacterium]|nr:DNA repair protein RecN [Lachnospiraceae bacterium]
MLESISVKNLALIKESRIELGKGLNILTGETGAGKSIILGSIRLALGERAGRDVIRTGAEYALIELTFISDKKEVIECMKELDLPTEPDGSIYISRRLMEGRSVAKCNGETISGRDLKRLAALLIDIHGQNDTKDLLDVRNYRDILDEYGPENLQDMKEAMCRDYAEYKRLRDELDAAGDAEGNKEKEIALARFELEEIEGACLKIGEDEELEERYRVMKNMDRIAESLSKASQALDRDQGAVAMIGSALRELNSVTGYDTDVSDIAVRLSTAEDMMDGLLRDIGRYADDMEFSEAEFRETENRLDTINHLKNKYGDSIEAVLKYGQDRAEYLDKMDNMEAYISELTMKTEAARKKAYDTASNLHDIRVATAKDMCVDLSERLKALSFDNVSLDIPVEKDDDHINSLGYDEVDILVSFNLGEPLKSLSKVASGGELSRFMLALKEATAGKDAVETLVFDEIDAGISGKTAWNVSGSMKELSRSHQVIAITHLPQIAARADEHYLIEKRTECDSTITDIRELAKEEKVEEIARLLSGGELTQAGIENARELIKSAEK